MRSELIDPIGDPRWLALVDRSPAAVIYHHPAWLGLLRDHYRYGLTACALVDEQGAAVAGLPIAAVLSRLTGRRLVALPFSDACPPLVTDEAPAGAVAALARAVDAERARRGLPIEVRASMTELPGGAVRTRFHVHAVPLEADVAAVEKRFSSQARRGVTKAKRAGLTVERRTDRAAIETFYALHMGTRRRLGVPTQPKRFVTGFERLFGQGLGFVTLVHAGDRPAAAAVFLRAGPTLTYKYGASDHELLADRPNNLLFAETIRWACANGCERLDLGRTDIGQQGLEQFKRAWGAEEIDLGYTYAGSPPPDPAPGRAQRAMAAVIRKSPPQVGRGLGELLYRHYA